MNAMATIVRLFVSATLALALTACGNDDDDDGAGPTTEGSESSTPQADVDDGTAASTDDNRAEDDGSSRQPTGTGSGTLTVAGVTFEFGVVFCGFDGDETGNEDVSFSMRGRGTTPDGDRFEVDAAVVEIANTEVHNVSLWIGDSFPFDVTYESERMDLQGTVMGTGEGSAIEIGLEWPFLEIDAKTVRAEGGFYRYEGLDYDDENLDLVGRGALQLTCP